MFSKFFCCMIILGTLLSDSAWADSTLDTIRERGKIVVGVKADYPPWGMRDEQGNLIGSEVDMAKNIAERLGVELELKPVTSGNRMPLLQQGKIDLIIATMSDTPARRRVVGIVKPNYYASGINALARKDSGLKGWGDLQQQPVCGIRGAWFNRMLDRRYDADMILLNTVPDAEKSLLKGNCVAWVYDDSFLFTQLYDKSTWGEFEIAFKSTNLVPWGMAVPLGEESGPYGQLVSDIISEWHREGFLLELERKWELPPSSWLAEKHELHKHGE